MSEWICVHCGETATSKCPHQRNVFPTDQHSTVVSNDMDIQFIEDDGSGELFINTRVYGTRGMSRIDVFLQWFKNITSESVSLEKALCRHRWILNSETETQCRLGCGHDNLSTYTKSEPQEPEPKAVNPIEVMREHFRYACYVIRNASLPMKVAYGENSWDLKTQADLQMGNLTGLITKEVNKFLDGGVPIGKVFEVIYKEDGEKERVSFDKEHHAVLFCEALKKYSIDSTLYRYDLDRNMHVMGEFLAPRPEPGFYIILRDRPGNKAKEKKYAKRYKTLKDARAVLKDFCITRRKYMAIIVDEHDKPVDGWEDHNWVDPKHEEREWKKARKLAKAIKEV